MPLMRDSDGTWKITIADHERSRANKSHPAYMEALPRYLTIFDALFSRAREKSEFMFLWSLFGIRGSQDAGWDPYETTVRAIPALLKVHDGIQEFEAARHLQLWIYGHIMEASEPYELLANLIDVSNGGQFLTQRFPPNTRGNYLPPGKKIARIREMAKAIGMSGITTPLRECWNRFFRNAIFHADYVLDGGDVRTIRPTHIYSQQEVSTLVNRTLAYHEALKVLKSYHISSYTEPKTILTHPSFSHGEVEPAIVIVREDYGATGIKDAWSLDEIAAGKVPFRVGSFTLEEINFLNNNPLLALLPRLPDINNQA